MFCFNVVAAAYDIAVLDRYAAWKCESLKSSVQQQNGASNNQQTNNEQQRSEKINSPSIDLDFGQWRELCYPSCMCTNVMPKVYTNTGCVM